MKKKLYQIHKYAGLTLGFLLLLLGISGVGITFRAELLPKVYPDLFQIAPGEKILPLSDLYQKANTHLAQKGVVTNLYSSEGKDEAWLFLYKAEDKKFPMMLTMNPFTGEVVGEMSMIKNFFALMMFLHANFLLGKAGSNLVGIMGLLLLFFIGSGLYVWLPEREWQRRLKKTFQFSSLKESQKSHHLLGILFAIPLFISATTGFLTVFDLSYTLARGINGEAHRVEEREEPGVCTLEEQNNVLKGLSPETPQKLISVHFCSKKNRFMKVSSGLHNRDFLEGYERLVIDTSKNEVIQRFNSATDPKSWNIKRLLIFPIHSGEYFGVIGKVINFLTGIGLILLWFSGIKLYLKRKRRKFQRPSST